MTIYILYILFCILLTFFLKKKDDKKFLLFTSAYLVLMMGLRSRFIGPDTSAYCYDFFKYQIKPWKSFFVFDEKIGRANYLYYIFNKIVSCIFGNNYTMYLLMVALFVTIALYFFIRKFSTDYCLSQIMLLSLGFIFFFMSGIKQTLAISCILFAFIALKDNKIFQFILLTIIATFFHNTALVVLIALPIYKLKIRKMYAVIIPVLIGFALGFKNQIASFLAGLVDEGQYGNYGSVYVSENNLTGLAIQCVIIATTLALSWKCIKTDEKLQFFVSIYSIGLFFQALTPVIAEFFRISMYFSIMGCVMLPYALSKSKLDGQMKLILKIGISFVFVLYFWIANHDYMAMVPYYFFWQHVS